MILAVPSEKGAVALRSLPCIAIDLGFSGKERSCGFASAEAGGAPMLVDYTFNGCVDAVLNWVGRVGESVMVIEAPLSAAFNEQGNPGPRGAFEQEPKPRWWSLGAGATTALAAQHFLRLVQQRMAHGKLHLIEGFVVGEHSKSHKDVAKDLLAGFRGDKPSDWHMPPTDALSVLHWLGSSTGQRCPVILAPRYA